MTVKSKITAIGEGGELHIQLLGGDVTKLKVGQLIDVNLPQRQRTLNQNDFYHLFVQFSLPYYKRFDPTFTHMELHYHFRSELLRYVKIIGIKPVLIARSTTELSISEFCEFMESAFRKAIEDVQVPVGIFESEYQQFKQENGL